MSNWALLSKYKLVILPLYGFYFNNIYIAFIDNLGFNIMSSLSLYVEIDIYRNHCQFSLFIIKKLMFYKISSKDNVYIYFKKKAVIFKHYSLIIS